MVEGTSYSSCVLYVCRDQMRLSTDEHPMMLAEPSQNEKAVREKMVEIMFEKYNVPGEYYSSTHKGIDVFIIQYHHAILDVCSRVCC